MIFDPRVQDERIRQALALAVDRTAIYNVILQRQGEISGALLPQWLSGYAFLFHTAVDLDKARALASDASVPERRISLAAADPRMQPIADRIAVNARDAGITVSLPPRGAGTEARLAEERVTSSDPGDALASLAAAFGLPAPADRDTPAALYASERRLLEDFRVIPLFHLPDVYGAGPRVRGGPGITPLGDWDFANLWLEGGGA